MPTFDPAFVQELWLAVVDKLALGLILVGVGFLANRKLEDYRAHRALATEVSKRRVALVGEIVAKTMEVEVAYLERTFLLIQALVDESRAAGRTDLPANVVWEVEPAMAIAIQMGDAVPLPPGASDRVTAKLAPANAKVDGALEEVHRLLASSRFWLGRSTHRKLIAQVTTISGVFAQLQPNASSFMTFRDHYATLLRERGDAESFLDSLKS